MFIINENKINEAKIMADLLRSGNTMLNLACPVCNNPLFKNKDNKIFCPICKKQVIIEKEEKLSEDSNIKPQIKKQENIFLDQKKTISNVGTIIEVLEDKINMILKKLEKEIQIEQIETYIKLLNNLYEFVKKLRMDNASAGI